MDDITDIFQQIKQLVCEFFNVDPKDQIPDQLSFSWGSKTKEFETSDPFGRVKIDGNKIVLKKLVIHDKIWILDTSRGICNYFLPSSLTDTYSGWNFATLITLVLIPTTLIDEGKKTMYRKEWLEFEKYFSNDYHRFNYGRWSDVFIAFQRTVALELLQNFLKNTYQVGTPIEEQLNEFLHDVIPAHYNEQDVEVLHAALHHQTMNVKNLQELLSDYSEATLYRVLKRLSLHVGEYYFPIFHTIGLHRIFFLGFDMADVEILKASPYFENTEEFEDQNDFFTKYWIPTKEIHQLLELASDSSVVSNGKVKLIITDPQIVDGTVSPSMFNVDTLEWDSVFTKKATSINIRQDVVQVEEPLSQDDLRVLKLIVRMRSTDYKKLSVEVSRNQAKQIVRKLERLGVFHSVVMWRRPSNLPTAAILVPISDYQSIKLDQESFKNIQDLSQRFKEHTIDAIDVINTIESFSWPFLTRDFGFETGTCESVSEVSKNTISLRKVLLFRLSGKKADIITLIEKYPELQLIGWHTNSPGTLSVLNDNIDEKGEWVYDFNVLKEVLYH